MIPEVLLVIPVAVFLAIRWNNNRSRDDVALVPGPKSDSFLSGNMQTLAAASSDAAALAWTNIYGGVTKLHGVLGVQRHVLLVSDPAALRRIFGSASGQWDRTARDLASFKDKFGPGIAAVEGADHVRQRRIISQALNPAEVRGMISPVQAASTTTRNALRRVCTSPKTKLDMLDWSRRCALDSLTMFAFGTTVNAVEDPEKGHDLLHTFDAMLEDCIGVTDPLRYWLRDTAASGIYPSLVGLALLDYNLFRSAFSTFKRLAQFSVWVRSDREENGSLGGGNDLLSALEKASKEESSKYKLSDKEIAGQIGQILFAGHDTVSTTLATILNDLATYPKIQDRLRDEIMAKKADLGDEDAPFTQDDYDNMPYLNAVIKESMRLNPVLGQTSRVNRADDVLPLTTPIQGTDGKMLSQIAVSKGTWVVIDVASSNRRKDVWGEDADKFNPDRWLRTGKAALPMAKTPGAVYGSLLGFMAGNRTCPGWRIAVLELQVFVCDMVQGFRIHPVPGVRIEREFHGVSILKDVKNPVRGGEVPLFLEALS
ncbi:cytochrome P450 [Lyophyllum atratum]|nr:cytochrome P450 [Lyophyllum atratum]